MHKKDEKNMVLYRKYRPETFEEVIGQDSIVKTIESAIKKGDISHAYLLCGPRGTGKTTIARLIARALGSSVEDIYELDAASNNKVEDVHQLREGVNTMPFSSKYKVYILDEVHMMSKAAWNALLKTLEEPPAHVVFILATTEIEKVPETIISRCQTFTFKKPSDMVLAELVTRVAKSEGYTLEEGGAELIAMLGDGSFRDTHGILQKVISFGDNKKITVAEIADVTGAPSSALVDDFLNALASEDIEKGFEAVRAASAQNMDMALYQKMILSKLRYALMLRYAPATKKSIADQVSDRDMDFLLKLTADKPKHISSATLSILLECYQSQRNAVISELPLELALVKILGGE